MEKDFDVMSTLCEKSPSYFLFRKDDNSWMCIIFIPDCSKVAEKLVYAATTAPLKANLDYQFEEFNASSPIEVTWKEYMERNNKSIDMRSEREKNLDALDDMEDQARKEFAEMAQNRSVPSSQSFQSQSSQNSQPSQPIKPVKPSNLSSVSATTSSSSTIASSSISSAGTTDNHPIGGYYGKPKSSMPTSSSQPEIRPIGGYYGKTTSSSSSFSSSSSASSVRSLTAAFENGSTAPVESSSSFSPSYSSYSSPANDPLTGLSSPVNAKGIGGFHAVTLPVNEAANNAISEMRNGSINWIEFKIENETIVLASSCQLQGTIDSAQSKLNLNEPRFYLYSSGSGNGGYNYSVGMSNSSAVFIYCCPDKSPQRLRMVYATAKQNVPDAAQRIGLSISKRLEIRESIDLTSAQVNASARPGCGYNPSYSNSSNVRRSPHNVVNAPHPIYSMMNDKSGNMGGMRKHIVLPPRGAY